MTEWDGRPANPEQDQACILIDHADGSEHRVQWIARDALYVWPNGDTLRAENAALHGWGYGERLYTPAEVAALVEAAGEQMRERAAAHIESVREWGGQDYYCDSCKGGAIYPDREDEARRIRALPLPADAQAALDAVRKQARREGMERAARIAETDRWARTPTQIATAIRAAMQEGGE